MPSTQEGKWSREQLANAQLIVNVGKKLGASARDIQIALMTAMQESGLRNLSYGDRDSLGLFQQRRSQGWGTADQIMDPNYSSKRFYTSLFKVSNRDSMSLTQAAQRVQRSAYPNAYAKWERDALTLLGGYKGAGAPVAAADLGMGSNTTSVATGALDAIADMQQPNPNSMATGDALRDVSAVTAPGIESQLPMGATSTDKPVEIAPDTGEVFNFPTSGLGTRGMSAPIPVASEQDFNAAMGGGVYGKIIQEGMRYVGTPYVWGGTSPNGFDCSGLIQYVYGKFGINLPRVSSQQIRAGQAISEKNLRAGDLVGWDNSPRNNGADHIAIYIGNGQILEAPRPGLSVRIRKLRKGEADYFTRVA